MKYINLACLCASLVALSYSFAAHAAEGVGSTGHSPCIVLCTAGTGMCVTDSKGKEVCHNEPGKQCKVAADVGAVACKRANNCTGSTDKGGSGHDYEVQAADGKVNKCNCKRITSGADKGKIDEGKPCDFLDAWPKSKALDGEFQIFERNLLEQ